MITLYIAVELLSPSDLAALKIFTPTLDNCAFVSKKIYGNREDTN